MPSKTLVMEVCAAFYNDTKSDGTLGDINCAELVALDASCPVRITVENPAELGMFSAGMVYTVTITRTRELERGVWANDNAE